MLSVPFHWKLSEQHFSILFQSLARIKLQKCNIHANNSLSLFSSRPSARYNFQSENGKLNIQVVSNIQEWGLCICENGCVCVCELQIPMLTIRFGACLASIRVFPLFWLFFSFALQLFPTVHSVTVYQYLLSFVPGMDGSCDTISYSISFFVTTNCMLCVYMNVCVFVCVSVCPYEGGIMQIVIWPFSAYIPFASYFLCSFL